MSAPAKSVRMTEDEIWDFLRDGHTGIFATLRSDGVPIMMPIWFAVVDRCVYVQTRGKKLTRVKNDSRASFLVEANGGRMTACTVRAAACRTRSRLVGTCSQEGMAWLAESLPNMPSI